MKKTYLLTILLAIFSPALSKAGSQKPEININSRYLVESVELSGVSESKISQALHDDMQKLVGEKYDPQAAQKLAKRLRKELTCCSVTVKARRGDKPEHVKVIFEANELRWKWFELTVPPVSYQSKEGWNGALSVSGTVRQNTFGVRLVNSADELLERNAGFGFRYENKKLGTERLQLRIDFDTYHQKWNPATEAGLAIAPEVPGIYRTRQNFAPSFAVVPVPDLKLSIGTSFQRLEVQYPWTHTQTAYAGTADAQYRRKIGGQGDVSQQISASYGLRTATRNLDSDYVYSRHSFSADYAITKGRNVFGGHFQGGLITGNAPLFERFSLGNSFALRGWNKFDVAALGGTHCAYGSLDYRYRIYQVFYDVGTVWDRNKTTTVRHGLGFGLAFKGGGFVSLAFPVRLTHVAPVLMLGLRY